jgi:hypothetical protein
LIPGLRLLKEKLTCFLFVHDTYLTGIKMQQNKSSASAKRSFHTFSKAISLPF